MAGKRIKIDLNYIRPNNSFIYPLYAETGEKVLEARVVLTRDRIKEIIDQFGPTLYYDDMGELAVIPSYRMNIAKNKSRELMDEVSQTGKLSKMAFREAEKVVDEIISDLSLTEMASLNLLKDLKSYEEYLYNHSVNVGVLSAILARMIGNVSEEEIKYLTLGAYLHDIGEMQLDKQLLNKEGKFDVSEIQKIKRHPQLGYETLKTLNKAHPIVLQSVLFHHEKHNNNGYYGLPYENLPSYPKILSICDIYDALTSKRPFREAIDPSSALTAIVNSTNLHFDYNLVSFFINRLGPILNNTHAFYAQNDICELSTQELALIKDFGINDLMKPRVIVFCKFERQKQQLQARFYDSPVEVDLSQDVSRQMVKILNDPRQIKTIRTKLLEKKLL